MKINTRTIGWLLSALMIAAPGLVRAEPSPENPTFGDIVDVRVINLEVVVTQKGDRVPGLDSDDFRLLVDGREVPIEYFTEVRDGRAVGAETATQAVPALEPGKAVGTRYLVFIDDYFSIPAYRNQALRALSKQLFHLGPEDRMAIVAFDGTEVEMLSSWTRSLMQLETALDAARERRAFGLQRQSEQRRFDTFARLDRRGVGFAGSRFDRGRYPFESLDLSRRDELRWQVSRVVGGATSALRAFARPQGRKVMLLLSGGWPTSSVGYSTASFFSTIPYSSFADQRLFDPLIDTANRLGYTLYPVDLNIDPGLLGTSAEFGTLSSARTVASFREERDDLEEDALRYLARATGGRASLDGARSRSLERAAQDTRSYYWLGFSPTWEENDQRHRVRVEMRGKGLKARTRQSFSDLSRESEVTMMVESAQLFDLPLPGQGDLGVSFGSPSKAGFKKVVVPVRLQIPLDQVSLLPAASGYSARLELRVAATDVDGATSEIPIVPVELHNDQAPAAGEFAVFETHLRLRSKPHRLLLSLYDPASGSVLAQRVELVL